MTEGYGDARGDRRCPSYAGPR